MSYRSEVKFRLTRSEVHSVILELKNHDLRSLFPRRQVHSIYFDNAQLMMFHESNEGVMPRKKLRLRTYPEHGQKSLLEIKVSSAEGRYKESKNIDQEEKNNILVNGRYFDGYGICKPTIGINYFRDYFQLKHFRVTLDRDITYCRYGQTLSYIEPECVLEVKFGHLASCEEIYSMVNLQPSRFSKYERAIKSTNM